MDAAQMLTAREIARQCEQLADPARQRDDGPAPRLRVVERADPAPSPPAGESTADGLTERERGILAFERQWWKCDGAKERAIRELFDLSAARYYRVLNTLLDKPEAVRADPMLIKRLRRVRDTRQPVRAARRLGIELH